MTTIHDMRSLADATLMEARDLASFESFTHGLIFTIDAHLMRLDGILDRAQRAHRANHDLPAEVSAEMRGRRWGYREALESHMREVQDEREWLRKERAWAGRMLESVKLRQESE